MSQDKEEDAKLKALLKNHVGTAPGSETLKTRTRQKPTLGKFTKNPSLSLAGNHQQAVYSVIRLVTSQTAL